MIAAYLNHAINLIVSILMVPVLLKYLELSEYILWAIFTTFGGVTLQIENSIHVVSVRAISREFHSGNRDALTDAIKRARKAYGRLSLSVLIPIAIVGFIYFSSVVEDKISDQWRVEWLVFVGAYALNYLFGINNSILLALNRVSLFNMIGSLTRLTNFVVTVLLLIAGFSVMGLCISFAVSVIIGCVLIAISTHSAMDSCLRAAPIRRPLNEFQNSPRTGQIVRYTAYTFAAFALYKGGVLIAAGFFNKESVGSYSLTIQALTLLTAVALVPIQVWLNKLVKAILAEDIQAVMRELARTLICSNAMFIAGAMLLLLVGNHLLVAIGSSIMLPQAKELILVSSAFLVELNILVLINFLVTKQRYEFVPIYVACAAGGIGLAILGVSLAQDLYVSLVVLPMTIQLIVGLPMIVSILSRHINTTPIRLLVGLWKNALARS